MADREEWRAVVGFEGLYEVSSLGRVRGVDRLVPYECGGRVVHRHVQGVVLRPQADHNGYLTVALQKHGKVTRRGIHQIVCRAFSGPAPNPDDEAAHNDGKRTNNRARNLRWATRRENLLDTIRHGTRPRGERHGRAKLSRQSVHEIRTAAGVFNTDLARRYGVSSSMIGRIRSGKAWQHL